MSIAANVGHSFADRLWHHGATRHARHARHVRSDPPRPDPPRRPVDIDAAVANRQRDVEQWSAPYLFAAGLTR